MSTAYVLININPGTEEKFLKEIKTIKPVKKAHIVMGGFDIVATLECESLDAIKKCINTELRYLDNVLDTQTLMAVNQ